MKFYTIEEVADLLGYHTETIRRYILSGNLKAYKTGKDWRIEESDLREFLEERSNAK